MIYSVFLHNSKVLSAVAWIRRLSNESNKSHLGDFTFGSRTRQINESLSALVQYESYMKYLQQKKAHGREQA